MDDRAAGRECRGDFPRREHERRVPRRDHRHRSDRAPRSIVELARTAQCLAIARFDRLIGKEAEIFGATHRCFRHEADGLAGIERFDQRNLIGARFDRVGDLVQDLAAFNPIHRAPGRKRGLRGAHCGVNIVRTAFGDIGQMDAIDRTGVGKGLAADGRNAGTGNVVLHAARPETGQKSFGQREIAFKSGHVSPFFRFGPACGAEWCWLSR